MEQYSVLMSLYIKEKPEYLDSAIKSMVEQTVKPDEIVIVKDGKITGELQNIIDRYAAEYPEMFNIVGYDENQGLGYALNYGLERCRNELIARMDTDDISMPNRCEEQLKCFENNGEIDIVGGDISEFIGSEKNIIGIRAVPKSHEKIISYMKKRCPLNHVTVMYKKSSVIRSGNYLDCIYNEDYYLWIRMYEHDCIFVNTGTVLVNVRVGQDMYRRRGGIIYFKSELRLQNYMLKKRIIDSVTYVINLLKRFIVQILLPNNLRGFVFSKFARKKFK